MLLNSPPKTPVPVLEFPILEASVCDGNKEHFSVSFFKRSSADNTLLELCCGNTSHGSTNLPSEVTPRMRIEAARFWLSWLTLTDALASKEQSKGTEKTKLILLS